MKVVFVLLFIGGALAYAWSRLNQPRRAQIIGVLRAGGKRAADMGRALRDKLERRKAAYRHAFLTDKGELNQDGAIIIAHLTKFCYAFATTAVGEASPEEMMRREGRRQVFIEIMSKLALTPVDALNAAQADEVVLG